MRRQRRRTKTYSPAIGQLQPELRDPPDSETPAKRHLAVGTTWGRCLRAFCMASVRREEFTTDLGDALQYSYLTTCNIYGPTYIYRNPPLKTVLSTLFLGRRGPQYYRNQRHQTTYYRKLMPPPPPISCRNRVLSLQRFTDYDQRNKARDK